MASFSSDQEFGRLIMDELAHQRGFLIGVREEQASQGQRLVGIEERVKAQGLSIDKLGGKQNLGKLEIEKLKVRFGLLGGGLALVSVVAGVIASVLG
jgi:hypothetical protein